MTVYTKNVAVFAPHVATPTPQPLNLNLSSHHPDEYEIIEEEVPSPFQSGMDFPDLGSIPPSKEYKIVFHKVSIEDSGKYTISCENKAGRGSAIFELNIIPPIPSIEPPKGKREYDINMYLTIFTLTI